MIERRRDHPVHIWALVAINWVAAIGVFAAAIWYLLLFPTSQRDDPTYMYRTIAQASFAAFFGSAHLMAGVFVLRRHAWRCAVEFAAFLPILLSIASEPWLIE